MKNIPITIGGKTVDYKELEQVVNIEEDIVDDNYDSSSLDVGTNFLGIEFSPNTTFSHSVTNTLYILTKDGVNWKVPDESRVIFDASRINLSDLKVDGGVIPQ